MKMAENARIHSSRVLLFAHAPVFSTLPCTYTGDYPHKKRDWRSIPGSYSPTHFIPPKPAESHEFFLSL